MTGVPPPGVSPHDSAAVCALYQARAGVFADHGLALQRVSTRISQSRALVFLLGAGATMGAFFQPQARFAALLLVAGCTAVFAGLVWWHERVIEQLHDEEEMERLNRQGIARLRRQWHDLPMVPVELPADCDAASARDLDLFGRASLFQLLCRARTANGIARLRDWLLTPASAEEIRARQQAVADLAPALDPRQRLELRGARAAAGKIVPDQFITWAEDQPWLSANLLRTARLLTGVTLFFLISFLLGILPISTVFTMAMVNLILTAVYFPRIHATFGRISTKHREIFYYADLFALISAMPTSTPLLVRLRENVAHEGGGAAPRLKHLAKLSDLACLRFSSMYLPIQALTLWDFHVLAQAETWQTRVGKHAREWFDALAQWECLASLAALKHDHPTWKFPECAATSEQAAQLVALGLGHPLLPETARITNDVSVGPPGTLLLVTGSNMSGKSTLLRALGTNVVLAQTGSVVCARHLRLPPLVVASSMRIQDSLEQGVSFYLAELKRLKTIVDMAKKLGERFSAATDPPSDGQTTNIQPTLLYLLDEILLGTNSRERQIAVQRVLQHLLACGSIGAVSTHDLELAHHPLLASACQPVHFRESFITDVQGERMVFDYCLRQGVATTTNALKLLAMVGLDGEHSEQ